MIQVISLIGALVILATYLANLYRVIGQSDRSYLLLNILGAGTLTGVALIERQWGFLLMESVWTVASVISLVRRMTAPGAVA